MKVLLKADFFIGGRRYRRGDPPSIPVEMPDEYRDRLPKDAVIVSDDYEGPVRTEEDVRSMSELARRRGTSMMNYLNRSGNPNQVHADATKEAKVQESGTQAQESGTQVQESGTQAQESGTQVQESGTQAQESEPKEESYPHHRGGGVYELSNGEVVRGKVNAEGKQAFIDNGNHKN